MVVQECTSYRTWPCGAIVSVLAVATIMSGDWSDFRQELKERDMAIKRMDTAVSAHPLDEVFRKIDILLNLVCFHRCLDSPFRTEEQNFLCHCLIGDNKVVCLREVFQNLVGRDVEFARKDSVGVKGGVILDSVVIRLPVNLSDAGKDAEISVIFHAYLSLTYQYEVCHTYIELGAVGAVRAPHHHTTGGGDGSGRKELRKD